MTGAADRAATSALTLRSLFGGVLERFGDRTAIVADGVSWSYRTVARYANRLAHALVRAGVGPGTPVALATSNCAEYVIADQALIRVGAAKVPLNDLLAPREIEFILRDSGTVVAIADAGLLPSVLGSGAPALHTVISVGNGAGTPPEGTRSWNDVLTEVPAVDGPPVARPGPDDIGLIIYTGGTTGRQKGVVHTQHGLVANLLAHLVELALADDERLLLTSPLPHSAGFFAQAGLSKGALLFLERRFDPELVLRRIAQDRVTFTFMVPTMIYRVLDLLDSREVDLSSLRTLLYGAAPITVDRLEQGLRRFGSVFMQIYGQTEAPNFLTRLRREDHTLRHPERLTSCGQPALLVDVEVHDPAGNRLGPGEVGEIVARAPYVLTEYYNLPDKTAETLRGGWLHTGDIGRMDAEGYVYLLDRAADMIITGGMNVYCAEVENVIAEYPGIGQVAVIGVPHPDWGEAVVACVTAAAGGAVAADELLGHCRARLAAYKCPKTIRPFDRLPVTAYGKIDKKALRTGLTQAVP